MRLLWQLTALALATVSANAYSFDIQSSPKQCDNLSLKITGSGGSPPYRALIVPFGESPLSTEVRRVIDQPFDGNSDSLSVQLKYPANSRFVVVVSDSNGFGTGGTTAAAAVLESSDSSCFNPNQPASPLFSFFIQGGNTLAQCQPAQIAWNNSAQGAVTFLGIIPGGQSFNIPVQNQRRLDDQTTGFNWTVNLKTGTTLLIAPGDDRGQGSGGSAQFFVGTGSDSNCINGQSPSSTAGNPAGGNYPTNTDGSSTNGGGGGGGGSGGGGGGTNVGAIAGGVVGGVIALLAILLVVLFLFRRKKYHRVNKERPDLLNEGEAQESNQPLPQFYEPRPFIVPESSGPGSVGSPTTYDRHGGSAVLSDPTSRLSTETGPLEGPSGASLSAATASSRKTGAPSLRPVNVIQHEDAGRMQEEEEEGTEAETVEVPPAYTNLRK